ncbi:PD-(D/E)XK nuclease family protein [Xanthobacter oligotrophicus]|nr:PD-(D/E)XK nuclease family protein [Xanthobacter oligotrophicus]
MESRQGERGFDQRPNPTGNVADGVEILTWHASKGREWPVVAVVGLDQEFGPRVGGWRAACEDYGDLDGMLERTHLAHTPKFHAPGTNERFLAGEAPQAQDTARRLLYVAFTRARDVLVLEWPETFAQKAEAGEKPPFSGCALLVAGGMKLEPGHIRLGKAAFPARISFCGKEMPPECEGEPPARAQSLARLGRRAILPRLPRPDGGPALLVPSGLDTALSAPPVGLATDAIGPALSMPPETFASATDRGTALHDMLRILLVRPDMADHAAPRLGLSGEACSILTRQAEALRAWLASRGYGTLMTEVPIEVQLPGGARVSAALDLVARGEAGLAIIDHKSDAVSDCDARFAHHWPQLSSYAAAVRALGFAREPILMGIHWLGRGAVTYGMK